MGYVINCDCGYAAKGETEDELIEVANKHIEDAHPEMSGKVTREELLAQAEQT